MYNESASFEVFFGPLFGLSRNGEALRDDSSNGALITLFFQFYTQQLVNEYGFKQL